MRSPHATAVVALAATLAGCTAPVERSAEPGPELGMYRNLAQAGSAVDAEAAVAMISAYRQNNGLAPLRLDPGLTAIAGREAAAMAAAASPASADGIKARAAAAGYRAPAANVSAGYHTLAEAFSGWRESGAHNRVMLERDADRMGIATAYAPGTKYRVFWAMVVARAPGP